MDISGLFSTEYTLSTVFGLPFLFFLLSLIPRFRLSAVAFSGLLSFVGLYWLVAGIYLWISWAFTPFNTQNLQPTAIVFAFALQYWPVVLTLLGSVTSFCGVKLLLSCLSGPIRSSEYFVRIGEIGFLAYLRILFFFDKVGLIFAIFVFVFITVGADAGDLPFNFWLGFYVVVILGRILFHRRIGIVSSEETLFKIGAVVIPSVSFMICLANGFRPFFDLEPLLGAVGVIVGFLISWPLMCIALATMLIIPSPMFRGYDRKK
jgi:hypothetical protein